MEPAIRSVEDLEVFRRAYAVSLEIHKASLRFPSLEQHALADQIRRASKSICANLAEGFSRQRRSAVEYKRFILMAIGSADEMQVWLCYCRDLGYVEAAKADAWRAEYQTIARMLQGIYSSWSKRQSRSPTPDL